MDNYDEDFDLLEVNWQKIREVKELGNHLNSVQQWVEASEPSKPSVLEVINEVAKAAGILTQWLIDLQIKLLTDL